MTELMALAPNNEQADANRETALMGPIEAERTEADLGTEIARLRSDYLRLRPLPEAASALESGVLSGGLLEASEAYGTDRVIEALRASYSHGGGASLHDTYKNLIPSTSERKQFLAGIDDQAALMHAVDRINEIGGSQDSSWHLSDQFERARQFDARSLASRKQRSHGKYNTATQFDKADAQIGFSDTIFNQSELLETAVAEGGDIVDVVKHLRDTYASGQAEYAQDYAQVVERVEAAVAEKQQPIQALRNLSDSILANEVRQLEATLDGIGDDSQRAMIADMLETRATEAQAKRSQLDGQLEQLRTEVLRELGAEHLDGLALAEPSEPHTIEDTRDWSSRQAS